MTVAVCATGLASTSSTPGRRDNTASTLFFEVAHCTPNISMTAVDCLAVMPLHNLVAVDTILGAVDLMQYTPLGYMAYRNSADE